MNSVHDFAVILTIFLPAIRFVALLRETEIVLLFQEYIRKGFSVIKRRKSHYMPCDVLMSLLAK